LAHLKNFSTINFYRFASFPVSFQNMNMYNVGILLFNDVEVLDFAGPFEVFSITTIDKNGGKGFNVFTLSCQSGLITARNGLKLIAEKQIDEVGAIDILIIPGGYGAEKIEIFNTKLLYWIKSISATTQITASVCTGAFLLAKAGLLDSLEATTHWMDIDEFESIFPFVKAVRNIRFIDNGHIITSAGISAGIEMSLHIVKRLYGVDVAMSTAKRMEYQVAALEI
jgi:transcriptional regulator GlxA family with amidase domain